MSAAAAAARPVHHCAAAQCTSRGRHAPPFGSCRLGCRLAPSHLAFTAGCPFRPPAADAAPDGSITLRVQLFGGVTNVSYVDETLELLPGNVKWSVFVEGW